MHQLHHMQNELDNLDQTELPCIILKGSWGQGWEGRMENKLNGTILLPWNRGCKFPMAEPPTQPGWTWNCWAKCARSSLYILHLTWSSIFSELRPWRWELIIPTNIYWEPTVGQIPSWELNIKAYLLLPKNPDLLWLIFWSYLSSLLLFNLRHYI